MKKPLSQEKIDAIRETVDWYEDELQTKVPALPADGHFAEEDVVWAMKQIQGLLRPLGLELSGFGPGVSACTEDGQYVRFDEKAWAWLEQVLVTHAEMRAWFEEARELVSATEQQQLNIVERCRFEAREAEVALSKLRHALASAMTVRGDKKERTMAQLLHDVAQWHRASGDTAVCEDEAGALDLLADQLGGLAKDAAKDIDTPYWGEM